VTSHSLECGAWSGPGSALPPGTPAAMPALAHRHAVRLTSAVWSRLPHASSWAPCTRSAWSREGWRGCTNWSAEQLARAPAHAGAGRASLRRFCCRAARPCPPAPRTRRGRRARPPPLPPSARPSSHRWRASRCSARAARAAPCAAAAAPPLPPPPRAPLEHGRGRRGWSGRPAAFLGRARAGARQRPRARRRPRRPSGGRGRRAARSASGP